MKIPANIILENLYTIGKEFIYESSYKEYQGYYYKLNDRFFAGKEFNTNSPRLLKLDSDEINPLRLNPQTSTYASLKRAKIPNNRIPSIPLNSLSGGVKYIAKKLNSNPIKIIFTTEEAWENPNKYPEYVFISVSYDIEYGFGDITEENRRIIPEIDIFLSEYSLEE